MNHKLETNNRSLTKYPNAIWFSRFKTDPEEIKKVLKPAKIVQEKQVFK